MNRRFLALAALGIPLPVPLVAQDYRVEEFHFTPILEIGNVPGQAESLSFSEIRAIGVLGDHIFVLEGLTNEIRVFDHEGTLIQKMGGRGEGPGEYQWPIRMQVTSEGVSVTDLRLRRQTHSSLQGRVLRTEPLGGLTGESLSDVARLRGGLSVGESSVRISESEGAHPMRMVFVFEDKGVILDTLAVYSSGLIPFSTEDSYGFLGGRVGSGGDWTVGGDSILAVVSGEIPTLRLWRSQEDGLQLTDSIRLPFTAEPLSGGDRRDLVAAENERRALNGSGPLPRSTWIGFPEDWGQIKEIILTQSLECWVNWDAPRTKEDRDWIRIDLKGGNRSRVSMPIEFHLLEVHGGKLYGFDLTDLDVPVLRVLEFGAAGPVPGLVVNRGRSN